MHPEHTHNQVQKLRKDGFTLNEISVKLSLSKPTVQSILKNKSNNPVGRPKLINKSQEKVIANAIRMIKKKNECVTSKKIVTNTRLNCSSRTVRRHLSQKAYKYRAMTQRIQLTDKNKQNRLECIKLWLKEKVDWREVVFVDEKLFRFDGPDDFKSWCKADECTTRKKRQMGGGSVMIFAIIGSDGYLNVERIDERINGESYKAILRNLSANLHARYSNFIIAQDNARPHTCKSVTNWIRENGIRTLKWPPYSPDLNLVEHIFHMLSQIVYDGPQFTSKDGLWVAIKNAAEKLNSDKKQIIINMYDNYFDRLMWVLEYNGSLYKNKL